MPRLKTFLRRSLNKLGYDFRKLAIGRPGRDLIEDIRHLAGNHMLTLFDVGANVGTCALEYVSEFPNAKVYCFEPFESTYQELCRNVAREPKILPLKLALGAQNRSAAFHLHSGADQNSLLEDSPDAPAFVGKKFFEKKGITSVEVKTLDTVCREHEVDFIDFIKIDTQGFELQVLRGSQEMLAARHIKVLLLEVNFVPLYKGQPTLGDLLDFLDSFGYCLVGFYNQVYHKNTFLNWADALIVQRTSVV